MIILILLIILSTTFANTDKKCKPADGAQGLKCYQKFTEITNSTATLDLNEFENADKINKLCDDFKVSCVDAMKCRDDKEIVDAIDNVVALCDAVHFLSIDFLDCDEKLDAKNSTCVQEWDPFPDDVEDSVKMAEIQKEACKNFFGKENCMEKEIKELCAGDIWDQFKMHYLALNKMVKACDFD